MHSEKGTFSSAQMRDRDRRLEERHRRELEGMERKIENLRRSNDDTRKQLFDVTQRSERLAQSLGFTNVFEAQEAMDLMDQNFTYNQCLEKIRQLEETLRHGCRDVTSNESLGEARRALEECQTALREMSQRHAGLQAEHKALQATYDGLNDKYQRAAERYKQDYKKWRTFSDWLKGEDEKHRKHRNEQGISAAEKKHRDAGSVGRKSEMLDLMGPDLREPEDELPLPVGDTNIKQEDISTPVPQPVVCSSTYNASRNGPSAVRQLQVAKAEFALPSASPTIFSRPSLTDRVPNSSDTEDDSQMTPVKQSDPRFKLPPLPEKANPGGPNSSDTEDDSQDQSRALSSSNTSNIQREWQSERPNKIRRLTGNEFSAESSATPCPTDENDDPNYPRRQPPQTDPGRRPRQPSATSSTNQALRSKKVEDYSAFKGRGRYGGPSSGKTINALYAIDPVLNAGVAHQYDEVVRGRDQRRHMDAGDCECCHDYYEAVGPLPQRLQPPLWRSPSGTPKKSCTHASHAMTSFNAPCEPSTPTFHRQRDVQIEAHKKDVSRHRHNWSRAKTPPDYWNIGFPTTQEVGNINERAEEMHRKKRKDIERDAANGIGKYRRR